MNDDVVKKWQIVAKRVKDLKLEFAPLGINTMQILTIGEEFTNSDFGIYTEIEFTEDERQMLFTQILELNANYKGSNGASGLSTAEFFHLQELILAGNFKFAKYVLARTEKKRELQAIKVKRESEQFTFESQKQSLILSNKMKQDAISDEERKKLLTARVTEIEKRITALYNLLSQPSQDPAMAVPTLDENNPIMQIIRANEASIKAIIEEDKAIDQQRIAENMQGGQQVA